MRKNLLTFIIQLIVITQSSAQSKDPKQRDFHAEVDPIAYIFFRGFSGHIVYQVDNFSYDIGVFGLVLPASVSNNKEFSEKVTGAGIKVNYHFRGIKGFFAGMGTDFGSNKITNKKTGEVQTLRTIGLGPLLGYRLFLQRDKNGNPHGIYLSPWLSAGYNFNLNNVDFANPVYKRNNFEFFPTVHIGYRF